MVYPSRAKWNICWNHAEIVCSKGWQCKAWEGCRKIAAQKDVWNRPIEHIQSQQWQQSSKVSLWGHSSLECKLLNLLLFPSPNQNCRKPPKNGAGPSPQMVSSCLLLLAGFFWAISGFFSCLGVISSSEVSEILKKLHIWTCSNGCAAITGCIAIIACIAITGCIFLIWTDSNENFWLRWWSLLCHFWHLHCLFLRSLHSKPLCRLLSTHSHFWLWPTCLARIHLFQKNMQNVWICLFPCLHVVFFSTKIFGKNPSCSKSAPWILFQSWELPTSKLFEPLVLWLFFQPQWQEHWQFLASHLWLYREIICTYFGQESLHQSSKWCCSGAFLQAFLLLLSVGTCEKQTDSILEPKA